MRIGGHKWIKQILQDHHVSAYYWARQCCYGDEHMAKDILQMAYLKVLEHQAVYKQKSSIKTWLFSVIRFTAIDELKRSRPTVPLSANLDLVATNTTESWSEPSAEPSVEPSAEPSEVSTKKWAQLLHQLSSKQKQVLLLHFYHNMTLEEIAEVMELTIGTVRTHYDRGKKNLKKLIEKFNLKESLQ